MDPVCLQFSAYIAYRSSGKVLRAVGRLVVQKGRQRSSKDVEAAIFPFGQQCVQLLRGWEERKEAIGSDHSRNNNFHSSIVSFNRFDWGIPLEHRRLLLSNRSVISHLFSASWVQRGLSLLVQVVFPLLRSSFCLNLSLDKQKMEHWVAALNYSKNLYSQMQRLMSSPSSSTSSPSSATTTPVPTSNTSPSAPPFTNSTPSSPSSFQSNIPYGEYVAYVAKDNLMSNFIQPSSVPQRKECKFTEHMMKGNIFTEGEGLKQYIDQFSHCCSQVLGNPSVLPEESVDRKKIICIYLGLKSLDFDNRDSFSCYSSTAYEQEDLFHILFQVISLVQKTILSTW